MKDIVIIGGGGHAKVIASLLKIHPGWNPIGYLDIADQGYLLDLPYLGTDEILSQLIRDQKVTNAVIGIGQIESPESRIRIVQRIKKTGIHFPAIIAKSALVDDTVVVGDGTVIMNGAIIQSETRIGNYSIVNTGVTIDHDCRIGDFVHIAPGSNLSGAVHVGNNVLVGIGACVVQELHIADNVIIAAGAAVANSLLEPGTYTGLPAKRL